MKNKIVFIITLIFLVIVSYCIGLRNKDKSKDLIIAEQQLINLKITDSINTFNNKIITDSLKIRSDSFEKSYNTISKFKTKITYEIKNNTEKISKCSDSTIVWLISDIRAKGGFAVIQH